MGREQRMTNREKFIEVFGEDPQQCATKAWLEQEYVPPFIINMELFEEMEREDKISNGKCI